MTSPEWTKSAPWIWLPTHHEDESQPGRYFLFRKSFVWTKPHGLDDFQINISADSRYRLFVNGHRVSFGPCKSYPERWHYETVDILPFLVEGENTISARVLRYSCVHAGSSSIISTELPGFLVHGEIEGFSLSTDSSWKCLQESSRQIIPHSEWNYILGPPFMSNNERVSEDTTLSGWTLPAFDDSSWQNAVSAFRPVKMLPMQSPWKLTPRSIPMLPEVEGLFDGIVKCDGPIAHNQWTDFIREGTPVNIPAGESVTVDIECQSLTTAFVNLQCEGGSGSIITLLYAECYEKDLGVETAPFPMARTKSLRSDSSGRLYGVKDVYTVTEGGDQTFEPFWFRAFRYIQLHIQTSNPLTLKAFTYRETSYPLEITTQIQAGPELNQIWDISLRTLQNCRHETYEDCPFYEQNQFASDSRLQMLFTYQISMDDRLARKTMEEFHASRCPDGLIKAQFPSGFRSKQIPQFSLSFVAMVWDHMQYFSDSKLVRRYLSTIDGILHHFDERVNPLGLVGQFDDDTWPFIDWVPEWTVPGKIFQSCMPPAYHTGAATINSLLYIIALMQAAELCEFAARPDTAAEYRSRAQGLRDAVNRHCYSHAEGLYQDGPSSNEYSQHSQVFAVLSETTQDTQAREVIRRMDGASQCSSALQFYVFRAVEKVGLYDEYFSRLLDPWRRMLADNLTTWAEFEHHPRSDCHGWSAGPINEIVGIYGVRPQGQRLRIAPRVDLLSQAEGTFATSGGCVRLKWAEDLEVEASADLEAEIVFRGSVYEVLLKEGKAVIFT
ncbi:unnamed protein product [Penicillium salamii]|uniref:Alpha-L-rhamnosidase n=1 Tax=Penicillium salamii TaxID=1612424 RepID=A0A9W4J4K8_9EURO|nr:unnamed protein product [Penicillium salamii]CAG8171485.1 unnamed protein product [Penicillium salamii]CAG8226874.1 unnamed protein product [Penicillium salamii]CAG8320532.1 unnamed protein product [Penicillium salamii]CAG8371993.1 unnamed protein product [Penicillium salamii]